MRQERGAKATVDREAKFARPAERARLLVFSSGRFGQGRGERGSFNLGRGRLG
ncbi:MAG: hypothetical protein WBL61_25745 [Bryobacteraceae bacterium]